MQATPKMEPTNLSPRSGDAPFQGITLEGPSFLSAVLDTSPAIIIVLDREGRLEHFNRACERITGYRREEVLGKRFSDIFLTPEEYVSVCQVLETLLDGKEEIYHENFWVTKSGERRLIGWSNRSIRSDSGQISSILSIGNDVTELREAESLARRMQERYRLFSESVDVAFWEWSRPKQKFEYFTPAFEKLFGMESAPVLEDPFSLLDAVHPDDREHAWQFWQNVHEKFDQIEYRIIWPDGTIHWLHSKASPRGTDAIFGTSEDVTQIVEARSKLEHNEQLLAEAQESANLGSWEIEVRSGIITWTAQTFVLFDRDPALGAPTIKEYFEDIGEAERQNVMQLYYRAIRRGLPVDYELTRTRKDGSSQLLRVIGKPYVNADKTVTRVAGSVQDVTKTRQQEMRIQNERKFLRSMIDTDPNFIFVRDRQGRFVIANQAVADRYGSTTDELTGKSVVDLNLNSATADQFLATDRHVFEHPDETLTYETVIADGAPRWLQTSKRLIADPETGDPLVLGIAVDITKQKQIEFDLKASRDQAETASRLKSEFIANVSHEIRTPLNGVIGIADILASGELSDEQRRHLFTLRRSAENLRYTLNDVLDFSKIEAGHMLLEYEEVDVARVTEEVVELYSTSASDRGLYLHLESDWSKVLLVRVDRHRLTQIIGNLVSNGLKFTTTGGLTVQILRLDDNLEVHVRDTGIGIVADRQNAIFDSFAQEDNSITRRFGGTGLGLAIVKQLTEVMGGSVRCESEPGSGSDFIVTFPIRGEASRIRRRLPELDIQVSEGESAVRSALLSAAYSLEVPVERVEVRQTETGYTVSVDGQSQELPGALTHTRLRNILVNLGKSSAAADKEVRHRSELVLIVEDNPVNQFVVQEQLRILGFDSMVASRAREALQLVTEQSFALILMDIQMPEMDGLEAASRMRRLKATR
jgi:PAS domain S-box-containing protein